MKSKFQVFLLVCSVFLMSGCPAFRSVNIDPETGLFPASSEVDKKFIKIFYPLAGIQETNYVYLRAFAQYNNDRFNDFMKDALLKIGFKKVYGERELARMVIQSGLSQYVPNMSDLVSLNNLARITGPFVILDCKVFLVADRVFRFDVQAIDPLSGETVLEISRIHYTWLNMDKEVNYPIINIIKLWYDASAKIPSKKHEDLI